MKKYLFILGMVLSLFSCQESNDDDSPLLQLRVKNVDQVDFDEVIVRDVSFGPLAVGESSDYQSFDFIYRYDYILLVAEGDTCILQPIDFVGETKYESGKFRYDLQRQSIAQLEDCWVEIDFIEE